MLVPPGQTNPYSKKINKMLFCHFQLLATVCPSGSLAKEESETWSRGALALGYSYAYMDAATCRGICEGGIPLDSSGRLGCEVWTLNGQGCCELKRQTFAAPALEADWSCRDMSEEVYGVSLV